MLKRLQLRNPFVQQYLVEIIFPLIGYFLLDWSIFIIGCYYLLDYLASQILFYRRVHWIRTKADPKSPFWPIIISGVVFLIFFFAESFLLTWGVVSTTASTMSSVKVELLKFAKEEVWLLLPLVVLVYHLKDQFTFYMPRHYLNYKSMPYIWVDVLKGASTLVLIGGGVLLWYRFQLPEMMVVFGFVSVKIAFDLTLKKWFDQKALS